MADKKLNHMNGRNFDELAEKFCKNIYGTQKGEIRKRILWRDLSPILHGENKALTILDAGGGEGRIACEFAKLGHKVICCDISKEMLSRAQQFAEEQDVIDKITFHHLPLQEMPLLFANQIDLVIFHAVLEWIPEQKAALAALKCCLKPQGILSLMFYNYYGLLLRNVMLGNFGYVSIGMYKKKKKTLSPDYPIKPEQVDLWLNELNFKQISKSGIRIFHDYVENKPKRTQAFDELLALEEQFSQQEPLINIARYIHILSKKYD